MNIGREQALAYLRQMVRIRRFEEKCAEMYSAGKIRGFLHLYIGEEAVACGVMPELSREDAVFATYREHGHALVRGMTARVILAEMYGKQQGCCHGHGGSMHLFDPSLRFFGGNAIVAGALPRAGGRAPADRSRRAGRSTACCFGEGAVAEGEFHESANLASLWKLPVLFVCENNLYAMGTALDRSEADTDLCEKARSYRMTAASADGMDVLAVSQAAQAAVAYVRAGNGPYFLELQTYRFRAHSMFDPDLYRSKAEIEAWQHRCPIASLENRGRDAGLIGEPDVAAIEAEALREIEDALAYAEAGTLEPVENLTRDVYARGPHSARGTAS